MRSCPCGVHASFLLPSLAATLTLVYGVASGADVGPAFVVEPFTYVYDVPPSSAPAPTGESPLNTDGWSSLEEGETTHRFVGCAVLINDRIMAVLRPAPRTSISSHVKRNE